MNGTIVALAEGLREGRGSGEGGREGGGRERERGREREEFVVGEVKLRRFWLLSVNK